VAWLKIAHRGASGTRPEHTRAALERAIELGVDMIELDVQLTHDRRLVVLHDRALGRTVSGSGAVRDHDLKELQELDAGAWFGREWAGARSLSLEEVVDLAAGRVALNVEIKSPEPDWRHTARALVGLLEECDLLASTIVSCFDGGALRAVRETSKQARLGVLWRGLDSGPAWRTAEELDAVSLHPVWWSVDAGLVERAHGRGWSLIVWTMNDPQDMRRLIGLGVDGIISDFPERFAAVEAGSEPG
jgi:glycerophosphoryl diester phosphodiesterase